MKKENTGSIRRLVDDSFGPSSQQTSVIYIVDWRICSVSDRSHPSRRAAAAAAVFDIFEIGKDFVSGCHAFAES